MTTTDDRTGQAEDFLRRRLALGAVSALRVLVDGGRAGHIETALRAAKKRLDVESLNLGGGSWMWRLPKHEEGIVDPTVVPEAELLLRELLAWSDDVAVSSTVILAKASERGIEDEALASARDALCVRVVTLLGVTGTTEAWDRENPANSFWHLPTASSFVSHHYTRHERQEAASRPAVSTPKTTAGRRTTTAKTTRPTGGGSKVRGAKRSPSPTAEGTGSDSAPESPPADQEVSEQEVAGTSTSVGSQ
jgi:hypothetical protein